MTQYRDTCPGQVFPHLCKLYCSHQHVDTCDTRSLPSEGNLNLRYPVGRMWRFQVRLTRRSARQEVASTVSLQPLGDPTVKRFLSRDMDSWILPRERAAVKQWEDNPG